MRSSILISTLLTDFPLLVAHLLLASFVVAFVVADRRPGVHMIIPHGR